MATNPVIIGFSPAPEEEGPVSARVSQSGQAVSLQASRSVETSIRQLIANGKCKAALEQAKDYHKQQATAASETLLVEAYAARIQSLLKQNFGREAQALMDLVRERFPAARSSLEAIGAAIAARTGALDDLAAPLNDPLLSPERRAAIEQAICREVCDLAALAACPALPPESPLRLAASALDRAFPTGRQRSGDGGNGRTA